MNILIYFLYKAKVSLCKFLLIFGKNNKTKECACVHVCSQVAIKVIDKKKARQDSYVQKNMKREPRIHQMVRHPHIVVLLEVKT